MKYYNAAYIAFISMLMIFFYAFGMELEINNKEKKTFLLNKIEMQQQVLNNTAMEPLYSDDFFNVYFTRIQELEKQDPKIMHQTLTNIKNELKTVAIHNINKIAAADLTIPKKLEHIEKRFHDKSLFFLIETFKKNKNDLNKNNLIKAYRALKEQALLNKQIPISPQTIPTQPPHQQSPTIKQQPIQKPIIHKYNEINFNQFTYAGLQYDYDAYSDCQEIDCNISDPFIRVDITINTFDDNGNIITSEKIPKTLPLPIFINDKGNVKEEISLPFDQKPFVIKDFNAELLQKRLPYLAAKFYNSTKGFYNEYRMNYLVEEKVLEKDKDDNYTHGPNGCKNLLERYFILWGIPETDYKQQPEPAEKEVSPKKQKKQPTPYPSIWQRFTNFFSTITSTITSWWSWLTGK